MFGFFSKIFAPQIETLEAKLVLAQAQTDFWQQRFQEKESEHKILQKKFEKEQAENRRHTDFLLNSILRVLKAPPVPARQTEGETTQPSLLNEKPELDEDLWRAAELYTSRNTPDYKESDVNRTYSEMMLNPDYWKGLTY